MRSTWLRVKAPFAAYRPLQAGSLRATLPVIPYSAAWGLALNLAGIETRHGTEQSVTGTDPAAPALRVAIGLPGAVPGIGSLFQQAHGYRVGSDAATKAAAVRAKGAKYHIAPVRREILIGLDVVLGISGPSAVIERIGVGIVGEGDWSRYGLPFAGDNNLLYDSLAVLGSAPKCRWYTPVTVDGPPRKGAARLPVAIDRADSSRTRVLLVAPLADPSSVPDDSAWVWTPGPPPGLEGKQ
jgi:CRISPR-associated protein Cas5t